ncbi:hypothetical protein HZ994_02015 [Akkermansiaceae bacterium]|nr:hypothetical protein HZ994_02015 [Akkermansiaceae bacterium]
MNAVETAVSARAEKGSGNHEGPGSSEAIGTLLNPANDSLTRLSSLFHNRFPPMPHGEPSFQAAAEPQPIRPAR